MSELTGHLSILESMLGFFGVFYFLARAGYNAGAAGIPQITSHRRKSPVQQLRFRPHVQALLGMAFQSDVNN